MKNKYSFYFSLIAVCLIGYSEISCAAPSSSYYETTVKSITLREPVGNANYVVIKFDTAHAYDPACPAANYITTGEANNSIAYKNEEAIALAFSAMQGEHKVGVTRFFYPGSCYNWVDNFRLK